MIFIYPKLLYMEIFPLLIKGRFRSHYILNHNKSNYFILTGGNNNPAVFLVESCIYKWLYELPSILTKYIRASLNMNLIDLFADFIYRFKFFSFCIPYYLIFHIQPIFPTDNVAHHPTLYFSLLKTTYRIQGYQ